MGEPDRSAKAIGFRPYAPAADDDRLVEWLASDEWPYHVNRRPSRGLAREWIGSGFFAGEEVRTFWMAEAEREGGEDVGLIRLFDLRDETPMFDLRIRSVHRGRGLGKAAVRWLTAYVFTEPDLGDRRRIEASTRIDNAAMRRVLRMCGYAKEAHYRRAWPIGDGSFVDAVAYGIIREDWAAGSVTPFRFEDEDPPAAIRAVGGPGERASAAVRRLWDAFQRRDWAGARALLHDRFRAVWPNTGETFDRDDFVRVNEHYPGDWTIRVERVLPAAGEGDGEVVSVVEVTNDGARVLATSFFDFDEETGEILALTEYWGDCGSPPEWRRRLLGRDGA